MPPQRPARSQRSGSALPSFAQLDHLSKSPPSHSTFNTGFREWLRKITSPTADAALLAREQLVLEQVKKSVADLLATHVPDMSSRDLRLYLRIISSPQLASIRELRFECFDLMCRKIGEQAAVRKLQSLDALMA